MLASCDGFSQSAMWPVLAHGSAAGEEPQGGWRTEDVRHHHGDGAADVGVWHDKATDAFRQEAGSWWLAGALGNLWTNVIEEDEGWRKGEHEEIKDEGLVTSRESLLYQARGPACQPSSSTAQSTMRLCNVCLGALGAEGGSRRLELGPPRQASEAVHAAQVQ